MKMRLFTFVLDGKKDGRNARLRIRPGSFSTVGFYARRPDAQQHLRVHQRAAWKPQRRVVPVTVEIHRGSKR